MTAEDSKADTASTTTDLGTPISCIACNKPSCHRLWRTFNNYWQLLALFFVVFFYTLIGGAIFNAVERPNELLNIQESLVARNNAINEFVDFLTNSTNLTTEEAVNVTGMFLKLGAVAAQADATLAVEDNPIWDFASAVFFCSTVITTIGNRFSLTLWLHAWEYCRPHVLYRLAGKLACYCSSYFITASYGSCTVCVS